METRISINDQIALGPQPKREDFRKLADLGYRCVVNLRTEGEPKSELSPDEEQAAVEGQGMQYRHIPVPGDRSLTDPTFVDRVRRGLAEAPTPLFVHGDSDRRAGLLAALHVAIEEGWPAEEMPGRAAQLGVPCESADEEAFVKNYVRERARSEPAPTPRTRRP